MELNRRARKGAQRNAFQRQQDIEALVTVKKSGTVQVKNILRNQTTYIRLMLLFVTMAILVGIYYARRMSSNGDWCYRTEIQIHRQSTLLKRINQKCEIREEHRLRNPLYSGFRN